MTAQACPGCGGGSYRGYNRGGHISCAACWHRLPADLRRRWVRLLSPWGGDTETRAAVRRDIEAWWRENPPPAEPEERVPAWKLNRRST